jgi:8-oxo-dGTP diphosphatase
MISVACAIIIKNNKILVAQRSETMLLPLKWEFPGGKVEEGEPHEDCLIREIKEELGLDIQILQDLPFNIHQYSENLVIKLIPFVCKIAGGSLELSEHKQAKWLKKEQLLSLDWAEADIAVVEDFISRAERN